MTPSKLTFMATDSENLSAQESLLIITRMINEAKGHLQKNSFYFLLWGWTIVIAQLSMFFLFRMEYAHPYIAWVITFPVWIFTMFRAFTKTKQTRTRTHFDAISGWLWTSFSIIIFTMVIFGGKINYQLNPIILLVTAMPTIVSGVILKFRPLIAGGIIFWICGIITFLVAIENQPLVGALAITFGYLVPGYLLQQKK
jgi:hypothetical protein